MDEIAARRTPPYGGQMQTSSQQVRTLKALLAISVMGALISLWLRPPDGLEDAGIPLLDADIDDVVRIDDRDAGRLRTLEQNNGVWHQTMPWSSTGSAGNIRHHLEAIKAVQVSGPVAATGVEFQRILQIEDTSGVKHTAEIGRMIPGGGGHYVRINGSMWVTETPVPAPLRDTEAIDTRVLIFPRHKAAQISIGPALLERSADGWKTWQEGRWFLASQGDVDGLLDALLDLRFTTFHEVPPPQPSMSVTVSDEEGKPIAQADVTVGGHSSAAIDSERWGQMTPGLEPWIDHTFSRSTVFDFNAELVADIIVEHRQAARTVNPQNVQDVSRALLGLTGSTQHLGEVNDPTVKVTVRLAGLNQQQEVQFFSDGVTTLAQHAPDTVPFRLDADSKALLDRLFAESSL